MTSFVNLILAVLFFILGTIFSYVFFWNILEHVRTLLTGSSLATILLILQVVGTMILTIIVPLIFIVKPDIMEKVIKTEN